MIQDLPKQVREAFLAHRLNRAELVQVAEAGERAEEVFQALLDPSVDVRLPVDEARFASALGAFGLDAEFAALDPAKAWSPYERALYRRLSAPAFDPAEEPAREAVAPGPGSASFAETARARFDDWDRDHDTHLEPAELDRAMESGGTTPAESAALVLLRSYPEALGSCAPDDGLGITLADLGNFAREGFPGAPDFTRKIGADFERLAAEAAALREAPPLQDEDMDPLAMRQNRAGSCVLLSTAGGLGEAEVERLFEARSPGEVTVRFQDGEEEIVYELTPAERLYHATGTTGQRWPGLLEVAIGQRLARKLRSADSARQAADGVPPEEAILALTGRPARKDSLDELSLEQTRALLADLCSRPGPRICGSRPLPLLKGEQFDVETLHNGIQNSHAYTVLGYDEATDTVRLRNPWNKNPWLLSGAAPEAGVFEMPLAQFYASFRWVAAPQA